MVTDSGKQAYVEEAYELLSSLESMLIDLEETPDAPELIGSIFRAMHTLKGSGAMFGFDKIATLTHELENAFDLIRNNKLKVSKELIDLTLSCDDQVRKLLDEHQGDGVADPDVSLQIIQKISDLLEASGLETVAQKELNDSQKNHPNLNHPITYRIRFVPEKNFLKNGNSPIFLVQELSQLGEMTAVAQIHNYPTLENLKPDLCYTYWDIALTTDRGEDAIADIFFFVEDECTLNIEVIDELHQEGDLQETEDYKKIGEILVERGDVESTTIQKVLKNQQMLGEALVSMNAVNQDQIQSALAEQKHVNSSRQKQQKKEGLSTIRVPSEKLDILMDLMSELVTVQASISQTANLQENEEMIALAEVMERLTSDLRDITMSIRMLPIGTTFNKFKRLVRDLSKELNKDVKLVTSGAETELDKKVIERLNDPLVHIIRNCIDHGIESPEEREALGKPPSGTISLSASHSGTNVVIQVKDDGKGIRLQSIREVAETKELLPPNVELSDKELLAMVFAPGFSTAQTVTNVSGRGVGMDVVKKNIESLRGTIEIDSDYGKGTTLTIVLPLTLAIIDGLLVKLEDQFFVIPLSVVEECSKLTREEIEQNDRKIVNLRGDVVPYINLREFFVMEGRVPEVQQIIIAEIDGEKVGFVVDYVIGEHQTVIKSLGKFYQNVEGISGTTILADGSLALILDLNEIYKKAV